MRTTRISKRVQGIRNLLKSLGLRGTISYYPRARSSETNLSTAPIRLRARTARYELVCRPGTSDLNVFAQVFVRREYAPLDDISSVSLIVDCGAYIGLASAYFLSRFPSAHLIAIEPDEGNFGLLQENLRPFAPRVTLLHAAIWSHLTELVIDDAPFRDEREWARQVREPREGETGTIPAFDIGTILRDSGFDRISLLKIDIEGAEAVIFAEEQNLEWLERVDNMVVELHDDSRFGAATEAFERAIWGHGFSCSRPPRFDEVVVCKRAALS
jgi:FkbM family methyltransferase